MSRLRRVAALAGVLALGGCGGEPRPEPRQAILILLDAARPDRFSSYGYARETTPEIDRLAADGVVFTSVFAQGTHTREALPALFYSRYFMPPIFLEIAEVPYAAPDELFQRADAEAISLPRALAGAGFHTAGLSAHSWIAEQGPFAAEFDEFEDLSTRLRFPKQEFFPPAGPVVDRAIAWLDAHRHRDYFLYLHVMDTHTPHYLGDDARRWFAVPGFRPDAFDNQGRPIDVSAPLAGANRAYLDALYDGDLRDVDRQLGRLFAWLRAEKALERTVIAITADHGEALLEHAGRFGHGGEWFDERGRIPFIVHAPRRAKPGRIERFGEQVDIAPTLLGLLGVPVPEGKRLDGVDLLREGDGAAPKTHVMMARGIRSRRYKAFFESPVALLGKDATAAVDGGAQLFDLEADPGETRDVHRERPAELAELAARYRAALRSPWDRFQRARVEEAPSAAFAIASVWFTTRPRVPTVETAYAGVVLANLSSAGWVEASKGAKSALVARGQAPPLEIEFPLPNGTYAVSLGMRGTARVTPADGEAREVTAAPIDFGANPSALWRVGPASLGSVTVSGGRFRATIVPTTPAFVLRWVGFEPPGARERTNDQGRRERAERLRGLGYVQ